MYSSLIKISVIASLVTGALCNLSELFAGPLGVPEKEATLQSNIPYQLAKNKVVVPSSTPVTQDPNTIVYTYSNGKFIPTPNTPLSNQPGQQPTIIVIQQAPRQKDGEDEKEDDGDEEEEEDEEEEDEDEPDENEDEPDEEEPDEEEPDENENEKEEVDNEDLVE